jgi:hypothetical protein
MCGELALDRGYGPAVKLSKGLNELRSGHNVRSSVVRLASLGVDGKIVLKWVARKYCGKL